MDKNVNALKAAGYTALWTFIAVFGLSLAGWLADWAEALTNSDATVVLADPAVLVKAALSAAIGAAGGIVTAVVRLAQANISFVPGSPPSYDEA